MISAGGRWKSRINGRARVWDNHNSCRWNHQPLNRILYPGYPGRRRQKPCWGRVIGGVLQTCKPGSVSFLERKNGDHLSSPPTCGEAGGSPLLAERRCRRGQAANPGTGRAPMSPYLALLQVGFSRRCVTADGRTLLPSDFNLIPTGRDGMFLCHFPSPIPASRSSGPGRYPAPCPEEPGLSSPPTGRGGGHPVCMALRFAL